MLTVKSMDVRENFKDLCSKVSDGETVIISRPKNENVIMLSEKEYNELTKAMRNLSYLNKLRESAEQLERGEVVVKSLEELRAMENE